MAREQERRRKPECRRMWERFGLLLADDGILKEKVEDEDGDKKTIEMLV